MPYLIDINIMQNSNWSTTKNRGQIRNVTIENVTFLEGEENPSRILGYDREHAVENVTVRNLNLFGKKITDAQEGKFEIDSETVSGVVFE